MLQGRNEIDIVVFLKDYSTSSHKTYQDQLNKGLENLKLKSEKKAYAVTTKCGDISVDILLTRELNSPLDFVSMKQEERYQMCCSTVSWQRHFIGGQPQEYHEFVRFAKYWKKNSLSSLEKNQKPSSYCIELIMLKVYQDRNINWSKTKVFLSFLKFFQQSQFIYWNTYYNRDAITINNTSNTTSTTSSGDAHSIVVVDPTNPTNNVFSVNNIGPLLNCITKTINLFKEIQENSIKKELKIQSEVFTKIISELEEENKKLRQLIYLRAVKVSLSVASSSKQFSFIGLNWTVSLQKISNPNSYQSKYVIQFEYQSPKDIISLMVNLELFFNQSSSEKYYAKFILVSNPQDKKSFQYDEKSTLIERCISSKTAIDITIYF